jgi:hypothetical protein
MDTHGRRTRYESCHVRDAGSDQWSGECSAQTVTPEETVRSVRKMLARLPYDDVFDFIVFRVDRGAVYLSGYSFEGRLEMDAEAATKRASGVEVENSLTVAPQERSAR